MVGDNVGVKKQNKNGMQKEMACVKGDRGEETIRHIPNQKLHPNIFKAADQSAKTQLFLTFKATLSLLLLLCIGW